MTIYNIHPPKCKKSDRMFAKTADVHDRHLYLFGEDDCVLAIYAPGTWLTCLREDAVRRVPEESEMDVEFDLDVDDLDR